MKPQEFFDLIADNGHVRKYAEFVHKVRKEAIKAPDNIELTCSMAFNECDKIRYFIFLVTLHQTEKDLPDYILRKVKEVDEDEFHKCLKKNRSLIWNRSQPRNLFLNFMNKV